MMWFRRNLSVGGLMYASRGDPSAYDWTHATLTMDGSAHTLDLSSIVPANAVAVNMRVRGNASAAGAWVYIAGPDISNWWNMLILRGPVASQSHEQNGVLDCDGQEVQYKISAGQWTSVGLLVLGWFYEP